MMPIHLYAATLFLGLLVAWLVSALVTAAVTERMR